MFRRCLPLAVLAAALLGCSNRKPDGDGGGAGQTGGVGGGAGATPTNPDTPAYAVKLRGEQKGDKVHVVRSRSGSTTQSVGGKGQTRKEGYRYEFTETVIEMPDDAPKPTRSDREYKIAEKTDETGELKPLSFSGKTVEVQVSPFEGIGYIFIVGGNAVQPPDRNDLLEEFQGGEKPGKDGPKKPMVNAILPKKPVKVGEEWAGDFPAFAGGEKMPFDPEKSTITAKLTKVYQKDGHQWGVIEAKIVQVAAPGPKGPPFTGTVTTDVTLDAVIDGSSRAGSLTLKGRGVLSVAPEKGPAIKLEMSITREETVTPVK